MDSRVSPSLPHAPQLESASLAVQHGFILVHDTLCWGVIPGEWDVENTPVFYDTFAEAEAERVDDAEMRADALEDAHMELDHADDGRWVEAAVLLRDGSVTLPDQGLTFTATELREMLA